MLKAMLIAQAKCDLADVDLLRAGQANTALRDDGGATAEERVVEALGAMPRILEEHVSVAL